jgi:hypothetical protein
MGCLCTYKIDRTCWVHLDSVLNVQRDNLLSIVRLEHCVATHWWIARPITVFRGKCVEIVPGKCYLSSYFSSTPVSSTVWLFPTTPLPMHFYSGRLSFRDTSSLTYANLKKVKKNWNNVLWKSAILLSSSGNRSAIRESGGRILLGDNKSGGAVVLKQKKFKCFWDLDFSWTPFYILIYFDRMRTELPLLPDLL